MQTITRRALTGSSQKKFASITGGVIKLFSNVAACGSCSSDASQKQPPLQTPTLKVPIGKEAFSAILETIHLTDDEVFEYVAQNAFPSPTNKNAKSIVLDFTKPENRDALHTLIAINPAIFEVARLESHLSLCLQENEMEIVSHAKSFLSPWKDKGFLVQNDMSWSHKNMGAFWRTDVKARTLPPGPTRPARWLAVDFKIANNGFFFKPVQDLGLDYQEVKGHHDRDDFSLVDPALVAGMTSVTRVAQEVLGTATYEVLVYYSAAGNRIDIEYADPVAKVVVRFQSQPGYPESCIPPEVLQRFTKKVGKRE